MKNIDAYVSAAIESFDYDPADSDFQRGYFAALCEVQKFAREADTPPKPATNVLIVDNTELAK